MKQPAFIVMLSVSVWCPVWGDSLRVEANGLRVQVVGVGQDAASDVKTVLEEQAALTDDTTVTPPLADDLAFFVHQRYRELGYRQALVTWTIASETGVLNVTEGQRYTVGEIWYAGNTSQPQGDLDDYLLRSTHERLGRTRGKMPFVEADLKEGSKLVQRYFQGQGFLDADVAAPVFTAHTETQMVDVLVSVKEGQRYLFGTVGATGELQGQERTVLRLFKDLQGKPFNEVRVETLRKEIVGIYEQRGYYAAEVKAEASPTLPLGGSMAVMFIVAPGPLFRIGTVTIAPGFSQGAQRLLRSGFMRASGRVYSPSELEIITRSRLDTGVFSQLEVKSQIGDDNTLDIDITGEEGPRTTLSASLGFQTFLGFFISSEARQVNFMDTGDTVRVKAEYSLRGLNAGVLWLDPAIFDTLYSLDAELAAQSFNVFDYERQTLSLRSTLKRRWGRHIAASLFAEGSVNAVDSDKLTTEELGAADYQLGTVGAGILLDYRDSPLLPSRGWMSSINFISARGSASYLRNDAVFAYYQPLTKKLRAAFSAKSSVIQHSEGVASLPIDLRVFNGGATSVRSFAEREMGPRSRQGNTPLGGLLSQTFSLELSREIIPSLELALFGDAGNLSETVDNPFSRPAGVRYAIGLGLRYKLPIGPLRMDYGFNPDRQKDEPIGALHITFGFAF